MTVWSTLACLFAVATAALLIAADALQATRRARRELDEMRETRRQLEAEMNRRRGTE